MKLHYGLLCTSHLATGLHSPVPGPVQSVLCLCLKPVPLVCLVQADQRSLPGNCSMSRLPAVTCRFPGDKRDSYLEGRRGQ
ncbi:hypothetical protein GDO81_018795 [Engystomops pustulosus]|uniref:Secreted protein n=1 Tax=Engystomops pustulosus TaxID=76066 RepID=A0AAV6ZGC1_ENGPU|nr:hypothetical protein GDO81_018795 [Engystomops pustulosus]